MIIILPNGTLVTISDETQKIILNVFFILFVYAIAQIVRKK